MSADGPAGQVTNAPCSACGERVELGDGERFRVTTHDETDGTFHHEQWNLCVRCWERWLDILDGQGWADRRRDDR